MSDTDTTQETPTPEATEEEKPDTGEEIDYKAEAEKWKALARKHENAAKKNAQKLQEAADAGKTEAQKEAEAKLRAEKDAADANKRYLRLKIATAKGIPEFEERLVGETEEELTEDATRLAELLKPGTPKGSADGGQRGKPADSGTDMNALLRKAATGR